MQATAVVTSRPPMKAAALPIARVPKPSGTVHSPHDVLRTIQPVGVVSSYDRGQGIFREGDGATHWYEVVSGVARTCKLLADGRRQIGEFLLPGDVFGFEVGDTHTIDVEAISPAAITRFSRARVRLLVECEAGLATQLQQLAFETVSKAHARLLVLARQTAQERVVSFILEMARRLAPHDDTILLPMTRQDIADYLCLTIETVCRTMSDLKRERLIRVPSPQHLVLVDRDSLEDMVGT
ncbi:MAG: helix-turn-helix domain-containing protein [Alphaproteobacteria bacterium]|nr:helix-turn-helix domain-containing protein [Alphaproteobacteria bacterium]